MKATSIDGEFALVLSRHEVIMIVGSLGRIEAKTVSDQALLEYVGGTRQEVRELASDVSSAYRAWMAENPQRT